MPLSSVTSSKLLPVFSHLEPWRFGKNGEGGGQSWDRLIKNRHFKVFTFVSPKVCLAFWGKKENCGLTYGLDLG